MTRRLRICHLITELAPAGAERALYELVRRLDRRRFDVRVAALRGGAVADWLAREGIAVDVLGVRGRLDLPKLARLTGILRQWQVDILHTHLFHADLVGRIAARRAGVPHLLHTLHTAEMRWRPWQFAFSRLTAGRCEQIIAVSESARDHHARLTRLPQSHYTVIPNGVDPSGYARDEQRRRELRQQWGVGAQPLAAYVGRLAEEKGLETLLATWRELHRRGRNVDLVIAGDGDRRALVERFIAGEPAGRCVRLLGFVDDVRGVLSAADLLVMPSNWEGFGLAAAEAMAAGLPVVGSRVAGLRDVVAEGETGLLVPVGDAAAMSEAILELADDATLRDRMGRSGVQRVAERFSIDATVAAHERLYLEIADDLLK